MVFFRKHSVSGGYLVEGEDIFPVGWLIILVWYVFCLRDHFAVRYHFAASVIFKVSPKISRMKKTVCGTDDV